jgi:hypothetical protein
VTFNQFIKILYCEQVQQQKRAQTFLTETAICCFLCRRCSSGRHALKKKLLQFSLLQHKPPNVTVHILQSAFLERSMGLKSSAPIHTVHRHNNYPNWRILTFQLNCVSNKEAAYGQISEMWRLPICGTTRPIHAGVYIFHTDKPNRIVIPFLYIYIYIYMTVSDSASDLWKPSCDVINTVGASRSCF